MKLLRFALFLGHGAALAPGLCRSSFGARWAGAPAVSPLMGLGDSADVGTVPDVSSALIALGDGGGDGAAIAGSLLWGLNLYFGFDWLLAPVGLDNDFNPATRTTVALGRLLAGRGLAAAAAPIVDTDGERPELGTRIGTGANLACAAAADLTPPNDR